MMALLNVVIVKLFIYRRRHSRLVIIRLSSEFFKIVFVLNGEKCCSRVLAEGKKIMSFKMMLENFFFIFHKKIFLKIYK